MTATILNNTPAQGKITLRFEWSANSIKANEIASNAAELLHSRGLGPINQDGQIPFDELSNQQKADILDDYLRDIIISLSHQQAADSAAQAARDAIMKEDFD